VPSKLSSQQIQIPKWTWKTILVLEQPGAEITSNTQTFTFLTPNSAEGTSPNNTTRYSPEPVSWPQPHPFNDLFGGNKFISSSQEWRNPSTWRISLQQLESLLNNNVSLSQVQQFNFLSNVPENILKNLKKQGEYNSNNPLSALLIVEVNPTINFAEGLSENIIPSSFAFSNAFSNVQVDGKTRDENSVFSSDIPVFTRVFTEATQFSTLKVDSGEINTSQVTYPCIRTSQIAVKEPGSFQITLLNNSIREVTENELSLQNTMPQLDAAQINVTKSSISQVNALQFSPTQVSVFQNDLLKISLPSSITSEQVFSSNLFHTSTSTSNNIYKDSSLHLWSTLFDPTFINFQITDLPTGQLAEAQITKFDSQGRPNGGTILIDHNANGVGWFIDQTPFDNTEFAQTLTDTAYRATTGDAYGKYDLLTSILHEMGHLAGIIAGNPDSITTSKPSTVLKPS
jgi:hypothetical protein